MLSQGLS